MNLLFKFPGRFARFPQEGLIKAGVFPIAAGRGHGGGGFAGAQKHLRVHHPADQHVLMQGQLRVFLEAMGQIKLAHEEAGGQTVQRKILAQIRVDIRDDPRRQRRVLRRAGGYRYGR